MRSSNYSEINHEIVVIQRDNKIVITLPDGKEIATLTVDTIETDIEEPCDGEYKWKTVPNAPHFFLCFNAKSAPFEKDMAEAIVG